MSSVIIELIPLMLGAALVPAWIILVLLMLSNPGGLPRAAAFVAGTLLVRVIQGVVFGYVFNQGAEQYGAEGSTVLVSTLLAILGLLMLILAYKKWKKEDDPEAPSPKWMSALTSMSAVKAFGFGALLMALGIKHWVFTLSALATITEAQLGVAQASITFVIYLIVTASLLLIPISFYALAPQRAGAALGQARDWLERNNRPITVIVSLVFGVYFLYQGIAGLLG